MPTFKLFNARAKSAERAARITGAIANASAKPSRRFASEPELITDAIRAGAGVDGNGEIITTRARYSAPALPQFERIA